MKINPSTVRVLVITAGVLLVVVGSSKLMTLGHNASYLYKDDPVFHVQFRYLMMLIGPTEILAGLGCIFFGSKYTTHKISVIAWLLASFFIYRAGRWWHGASGWCGCLGQPAASLGLSDAAAEWIVRSVLAYLTTTVLISLPLEWRKRNVEAVPP